MGADLFSIGRSSLSSSKKSLATTSHNIANANTEGFSRQVVNLENTHPIYQGKNAIGTGVDVKSVKRVHDKLIEKKLQHSVTDHSFNEERTYNLSQVEEIFNEVNSEGMNKVLNRFFNTFRELSNQPENEVVRNLVRDNADIVVKDFKRLSESITTVKNNIDHKIVQSVVDINSLSETVAKLNIEIIKLENVGGETGDLRDKRDLAVKSLSEFFKINSYEDNKGRYVVNVVGSGSLVAGGTANLLKAGKIGGDTIGSYKDEGRAEIYFESKPSDPMSTNIKTGSLGALLQTRNEDVTLAREQIDQLAHGLVHSTNAIHRRGYINRNLPVDQNGEVRTDLIDEKITNINFFKEPLNLSQASSSIELSDEIKNDINNISTGLAPNSPGDNRIALAISKLQHEKVLGQGTKTLEEAYLQSVGKIGLTSSKSKINTEQSSGILAQAKSLKERLSGVSIDEETTNMVKYQHAYDASARMIKTADEMFDSVLNMIR